MLRVSTIFKIKKITIIIIIFLYCMQHVLSASVPVGDSVVITRTIGEFLRVIGNSQDAAVCLQYDAVKLLVAGHLNCACGHACTMGRHVKPVGGTPVTAKSIPVYVSPGV